jgi:murein DD-endopeptidase MepM/ murein hydrolase activator NlpD
VIQSSYSPKDYGNYVEVEWWNHEQSFLFAHLSERKVHVGQKVARGQIIGLSGSTGNSTGPHVHCEQRHSPFTYWDFEKPDWA